MADVTRDDLRAAVNSGQLSESQAAALLALAETRAGVRAAMTAEDEPFELFRGFSEIFVTVGLTILFVGMFGILALSGDFLALLLVVPACIPLAEYFTVKRRMVLPSILITGVLALAVLGAVAGSAPGQLLSGNGWRQVLAPLVTGAALLVWFQRYRVPFTMFLFGLCGLMAIVALTGGSASDGIFGLARAGIDLADGTGRSIAIFAFGLLALGGGIWFDMSDPHRLGRMSASGFWLHVLAAPALVNTLALTFYHMGPGRGYLLLAAAIAAAALLALVIDRRSFLTAALGYLVFLIFYVMDKANMPFGWFGTLMLIGAGLTLLGAQWAPLRGRVMRLLPDFPGKSRLPPYASAI